MDLLTGGTGFLGHAIARRLAQEGRTVRLLVRPGTDRRRIPTSAAEIVWGSLDEPDVVARALEGIDIVFHCAARVSATGGKNAFHADNVLVTERLLEAARTAGVRRFFHSSSAGTFGVTGSGEPITEDTPLDPRIEQRGAYAWSKAEADRRVRAFATRTDLPAIVVRPGLLYGPGAKPVFARLALPIPRSGGRKMVVGHRDALLPLTFVDNAADAVVLAGLRGRPGRSYNVIDADVAQGDYLQILASVGASFPAPRFVSPRWLAPVALACEIVGRVARRNLPLSRYKLRRATESLRYDTRAAREELGWRPTVGLADGLARTVRTNGHAGPEPVRPGAAKSMTTESPAGGSSGTPSASAQGTS